MKRLLRYVVVRVLVVIAIIFLLHSCNSASGKRVSSRVLDSGVVRGKVIENGTIVRVYLTLEDRKVYRALDTVWVNLSTHCIDDIDSTTMKVVLYASN